MKHIITLLLFLSLGACTTTKPRVADKKSKIARKIAENITASNMRFLLSKMGAVFALKPKSDGSFCYVDVRGNPKLTPAFVKPDGGHDQLSISDIPVCDKEEKKDFQKQAKNLYIEGLPAKKTSYLAILNTVGLSISRGAGLGCLFGAGLTMVNDIFSLLTEKGMSLSHKIGGGIMGASEATDTLRNNFPNKSAVGVTARIGGVGLSYTSGIASGITGAILCEGGIIYVLKNKKTDM